ncbi:hypothetical protein [Sphaerisporangium rhizosphaerae]|uniref:Uncharacterized protein n=1 Tax=Sphaerisporangium rhizosphaerae TaxID=2269375 RepID=A0ABW2PIE0_9ACTN
MNHVDRDPLGELMERPRYFPRQLVTHAELNQGDGYLLERMRRHNRMLHGWGVVCGALVCRTGEPWHIRITPGYLLSPYGDEVSIPSERVVDVRSDGVSVDPGDAFGGTPDPWCDDPPEEPRTGRMWVAVRYEELAVRPVRVHPAGCGCDSPCEYSRWRDGYAIGLLTTCPASHQGEPPPFPPSAPAVGPCPSPPADPWVVLASIEVAEDGTITEIDNRSCRRLVLSLADAWLRCPPSPMTIKTVSVTPSGPQAPGTAGVTVTATAGGLAGGVRADLGLGVRVDATELKADGTTLMLTVHVLNSAAPGPRALVLTNPDHSTSTYPDALTVS